MARPPTQPTGPGHVGGDGTGDRGPRVLRIAHSGVVTAWRERERELLRLGARLTLVTAVRWEEGGSEVECDPAGDSFVVPVHTVGRHPNLFVYDPRPLWRLLGSEQWDLIDLHEEPFGLAVAEALLLRWLRRRRTPVIVASAQNLEKRYPPPFRWFERRALHEAAGAYTCNSEAGRILRAKGFRGVWTLLPLGVDVDRFHPAPTAPPTGTLRIGFVGRLIPHKGVDVLLRAAALDERFVLEVFGAGPASGELARLAELLGVRERVTFHGFVREDEVPEVYRRFDVLAVPSVPLAGWIEQFGRVVVEAQASGVPVVASASGALPDVVGQDGLLVPPGDSQALGRALARLLDEPGLWGRLRTSGIAHAAGFSWATVARDQLALYEQVSPPARDAAG
ncbi:MAG: glycosyltransferase family 4 protein [Acidimicrobiales bacterium]